MACCVVFAINELAKPAGQVCVNVAPGGGCRIYAERPPACRIFHCGYRTWSDVPDDWRPDRCHFVIGGVLAAGHFLSVTVDPLVPDAWTRPPYYQQLKRWAAKAEAVSSKLLVFVAGRAIVIETGRDLDLGVIGRDELLLMDQIATPQGSLCHIVKIRRDDPRAVQGGREP